MEQNTENFGNRSLHLLFDISKLGWLSSIVSKVDGLSRIVPNLTFWFNDLILQRSRSLHKNYSDPRDGHSMGLRGAPKEGKGSLTSLT